MAARIAETSESKPGECSLPGTWEESVSVQDSLLILENLEQHLSLPLLGPPYLGLKY